MIDIKYNEGFTIIELLVSLSIVSMVMLAFFTIINTSTISNSKNESDIKSMQIAQSQVENIRTQLKKEGRLESLNIKYNEDSQGNIKEETISLKENTEFSVEKEFNNVTSDEKQYNVNLNINREKGSANKYLYNITILVKTNLSKKETILNTSILDS